MNLCLSDPKAHCSSTLPPCLGELGLKGVMASGFGHNGGMQGQGGWMGNKRPEEPNYERIIIHLMTFTKLNN